MQTRQSFEAILSEIKYKDWQFTVGEREGECFLMLKFTCACSVTGEKQDWTSRKWVLSKYMVRDEIVKTAFKAVETAEFHEVRENFKWKNKAIFGPHISVEALLEVADRLEVRA